MGNGFQFIDIILFAMIAAFLIFRLRNVLGRRDGHEGGFQGPMKPGDHKKTDTDDNGRRLPETDQHQSFIEYIGSVT